MEQKILGGGTEQYLKPEMEVVEIEKADIVTVSCDCYLGIDDGDED